MRETSPRTLVLVALAVCTLLALAGCSALSDGHQTRTGLDVNESEYTAREAVRNGSVVEFDAARDHAPNPHVLVAAHKRAVADRSYTVSINRVTRNESGPVFWTSTTSRIASNHSRYSIVAHANYSDERESTVRTYANGTHVWERRVGPNTDEVTLRTAVGKVIRPAAENETGVDEVYAGLYQTNVTDVVRVEDPRATVDGAVYRVQANETARGVSSVQNVSLALTVTESGRILTYDYRHATEDFEGRNVTVHVRVEFHDVDETTVTRPEWVPANATAATATTRTSGIIPTPQTPEFDADAGSGGVTRAASRRTHFV